MKQHGIYILINHSPQPPIKRRISPLQAKVPTTVNIIAYIHQCLQNYAYIQKCYSICTVTVALQTNILLISHFASFFSLSSPSTKPTQTSSLPHHLLLPLIHTNTPTHTDTPTNPASQNQHRPTIHTDPALQNQPKIKHTYTRTHQQRQREHFCELVAVSWCLEVD